MNTPPTLEQRVARIEEHIGLTTVESEPEPDDQPTLKRVAVVVGHSRIGDAGSISHGGISEWEYNRMVAIHLKSKLMARGYHAMVVYNIPRDDYRSAMSWVADKIKEFEADIAIELHFNASGSHTAKGHEWLYWHTSVKGRKLASCLEVSMIQRRIGFPVRGTKPKESGDLGAHFLSKTHCPAIICEPFFGDNEQEWDYWKDKQEDLAEIDARAIDRYFEG